MARVLYANVLTTVSSDYLQRALRCCEGKHWLHFTETVTEAQRDYSQEGVGGRAGI